MKKMFVCLLLVALLPGVMAAMAAPGDGDSRATHSVLVEFASWSW